MICIEHVTKRFGRFVAVDGVSLALEAGDSVALWGTNGAGKSTLIKCLLGLHRYRGKITVGGHDAVREGRLVRRLIGYVPQELAFHDDLRVAHAVAFFARLKGCTVSGAGAVLGPVGLSGQEAKRVRDLSGGMKQRLALALALLGDPPVLVMDEVTASLDAGGRHEFVGLLAQLRGSGKTLLFASHRVEEVSALARRVVRMEGGRITGERSAEEFAAQEAPSVVLHLHMKADTRQPAVEFLRSNGYMASVNGVGILVPVASASKAAALRMLESARFTVDDFEVLGASQNRRG